jgi:low temperature requirement protein LtrA
VTMRLPPVHPRSPDEGHRAATQLELFFDLVIVIAIASLTEAFHHAVSEAHGLAMLANFTFIFFAIWWVWMNYVWYASAFDNDDALHRVLTIVIMFGATLFAAGAAYIFETLDFRYGLAGWIIMRLGMILLWVRVAIFCPDFRSMALRYATGYLVAQALWVMLYLAYGGNSGMMLTLGPLVFLVELALPYVADPRGTLSWHRHHIIERYGLLNIIVLGEVLLSVALTLGHFYEGTVETNLLLSAVSGTIIIFVIWWLYFIETEHLTSRDLQRALFWGYGHFFIFIAGALLAVGLGAQMDYLTHHSKVDANVPAVYVNGAVALYLVALWAIRDRFHALGWRGPILLISGLGFAVMAFAGLPPEITALGCLLVLVLRLQPGRPQGEVQS